MTKSTTTTKVCVLAAALTLAAALEAGAQGSEPSKIFLGVNVAGQAHSHTFSTTDSFPVYSETATIGAAHAVSGGFIFDVSGGYRITPDFGVAVALSTYSESGSATMIATVPHPIFFDRLQNVQADVDNLDRRELGFHISAVWFVPTPDFLPDDVRIALLVGPSFFNVEQNLVGSATIPAGTQNALPVVETESKTGVGFNGGFDVTFPVTPRVGVGGFIRYAGGTLDLPSVEGMKAGGMQAGAGLRLSF